MEFQLLRSAQRACDWSNKNNHIGVLLGPQRLKRFSAAHHKKKRPQQQQQQRQHVVEEDETDETGSQQSSVDRGSVYRLDSGNSLDSGLECCSSSIGSMESDAQQQVVVSREEVSNIEAAIAKLKTTTTQSSEVG